MNKWIKKYKKSDQKIFYVFYQLLVVLHPELEIIYWLYINNYVYKIKYYIFKVPDDIVGISKLCSKYDINHLINNAYGL